MDAIATVGFIGTGNMGSAMIRGLSTRDDVALVGTDLSKDNLAALDPYRLEALGSALEVAQRADYVILAIKPQDAERVCKDIAPALEGKCLVSICAGIRQETLSMWVDDICPVVRVMPNTPAMVGAGVFAVCLEDKSLTEAQSAFAAELFTDVGDVHILPEKLFDAFTAVAGSGPAYVFYFMDALIEGGGDHGPVPAPGHAHRPEAVLGLGRPGHPERVPCGPVAGDGHLSGGHHHRGHQRLRPARRARGHRGGRQGLLQAEQGTGLAPNFALSCLAQCGKAARMTCQQ